MTISLIDVTAESIENQGLFCVKNKKHKGYLAKRTWLETQFKHGLTIKILHDEKGKALGFIEYTDSEHSFRPVTMTNALMIHCIWSDARKAGHDGTGKLLISSVLDEARKAQKAAVLTVTSQSSFMSDSRIYEQCGFELADTEDPYSLLVHSLDQPLEIYPKFPKNLLKRASKHQELELLYSNQCPYIGKAVDELPIMAKEQGFSLILTEIKTAKQAQKEFASPYGVFNLFYQGRLLADHPISATRLKNILTKEL